MKVIIVKRLPVTATLPTRVKAICERESLTFSCHSIENNPYEYAATQMMKKLNFKGRMVGGHLNDSDMVFVFTEDSHRTRALLYSIEN